MLFLTACTGPASQPQSSAPNGIITLGPHITETVFALGQGQRIVAIDTFSDYPPEATQLPRVGGYIDPDLEKIALLNPQFIFAAGKNPKIAEFTQVHHITTIHVAMDSLQTIKDGITTIGQYLECPQAAQNLISQIDQDLDTIRQALNGQPRPKVFIITGRSDHNLNNLFTAGGKSFLSEIISIAGSDNLYQDTPEPYFEASKETIVVQAPDIILEFHAGETLTPQQKDAYLADWDQLPSLPAVKNHRIYLITQSHTLRPGPRISQITYDLATLLHPGVTIPPITGASTP